MSSSGHKHTDIAVKFCFMAVVTVSASGCLHALGLARPSIGPRASIDVNDDSTVRSQDSNIDESFAVSNQTPAIVVRSADSESGHAGPIEPPSFTYSNVANEGTFRRKPIIPPGVLPSHTVSAAPPRARLLVPQFNPAGSLPVTSTQRSVSTPTGTSSESNHSSETIQRMPDSKRQPTLGFTADNVKAFLNRQSKNEMSDGNVLSGQKELWKVLPAPSFVKPTINVQQVVSPRLLRESSDEKIATDAVNSVSTATSSKTVTDSSTEPSLPTPTVSSESERAERSMLDRLKGFYEPATEVTEATARRIWRRPFKLSNPWNAVFGDREPEVHTAEIENETQFQAAPAEAVLETSASPTITANTQELLKRLIAETVLEIKNWPQLLDGTPQNIHAYRRKQQDLRLLYLVADQPGRAIQAVDALSVSEQEFWQELMLAMAEYRSENYDDPQQRFSNTAAQLRSAIRQLAPSTALQIRRFEICRRIHSFGRIEPFPSNDFDPGDSILLYAEVDNFATTLTPQGSYRTQFEAQLTLFEQGNSKPKEVIDLPNITDEATSERSDYYQSFELNLPSHKSGQYLIRLRLRDKISGKTAEDVVEFQVR